MEASPCARGCGFYGSPEQRNLCSACYKAYLASIINTTTPSNNPIVVLPTPTTTARAFSFATDNNSKHEPTSTSSPDEKVVDDDSIKKPIIKMRCNTCHKRVGLLGFKCRCGHLFCGAHRYPEEHECEVDLKSMGRQQLAKQNPVCVADRMKHRI